MNITPIIEDIQSSILQLQKRLDELRVLDDNASVNTLLTRQQAADFLGISLRQLDRDCSRYGISKISTINGVRIRRHDLLMHMGAISNDFGTEPRGEFERIICKAKLR